MLKRIISTLSLITAIMGFMAFNVEALPIKGAVSFSGTSVQNNQDLSLATEFTAFTAVVVSATGGTEDYASILSGTPVTFNAFTFRPALDPNPLIPLWAFNFDGKAYSFDAIDVTINHSSYHTIVISGPGIAHITGFDDTPGNYYFTANGTHGTASFSVSTDLEVHNNPVPEPATMILFGIGLLGLGTLTRRGMKKEGKLWEN